MHRHLALTGIYVCVGAIGAVSVPLQAKTYLTIEQAQVALLPHRELHQIEMTIPQEVHAQMRTLSKVRYPFYEDGIWRSDNNEWFIVDEVVGKHEMIQYAVVIDAQGKVSALEVLRYNESYGGEVMQAGWRNQFTGKTINDTLLLNQDIQNISGATLSCKHLTEGVKRVLVLYDRYLKKLP